MREYITRLLNDEGIDIIGVVSLADVHITKQYLLDRAGIHSGSVVCFAIPYYAEPCCTPNISAYAYGEDYHAYTRELGERLCSKLRLAYPQNKFALFSDHSPIDERHAAASAGLGVIGTHGMLITEKYSSYVFLSEMITDAELGGTPQPIRYCENCGACRTACPYGLRDGCLSALTQKKGALGDDEIQMIKKYCCAWGCDICTEVCPHTKKAFQKETVYSPISFFNQNLMPQLTVEDIENMDDETFARRAYSWRGRDTIIRNLKLLS